MKAVKMSVFLTFGDGGPPGGGVAPSAWSLNSSSESSSVIKSGTPRSRTVAAGSYAMRAPSTNRRRRAAGDGSCGSGPDTHKSHIRAGWTSGKAIENGHPTRAKDSG